MNTNQDIIQQKIITSHGSGWIGKSIDYEN